MNAGFGSLTVLKAQLLAEVLRADTAYDAALLAIGQGVVAKFENAADRKFARVVGYAEALPADRVNFLLERFPLESISTIELKLDEATGWVAQTITDFVRTIDLKNGLVILPDTADAGPYWGQVRFTYTGGYWFDETEEGTDSLPSGATALPADLTLAWILQCRAVWSAIDKLGVEIIKTGSAAAVAASVAGIDLVPAVKDTLGDYARYSLT